MSKFKKQKLSEGFLAGERQDSGSERFYTQARLDVIFRIENYIETLKNKKTKTAYEKRKVLNQLEVLEYLRCDIKNFVRPNS